MFSRGENARSSHRTRVRAGTELPKGKGGRPRLPEASRRRHQLTPPVTAQARGLERVPFPAVVIPPPSIGLVQAMAMATALVLAKAIEMAQSVAVAMVGVPVMGMDTVPVRALKRGPAMAGFDRTLKHA